MSPRIATFLMFVVNGAVVGTWIANVPAIQVDLAASATQIGIVLLCLALGALVAQQVTGQLLVRVSSRRMVRVTSLILPPLAVAPLLAPDPLVLALVVLVFGAANTAMDVSINAHGVALETRGGRSIVSGLHAGWSIGGALGAAAVAAAAAVGLGRLVEAVIAAAALWLLALVAGRWVGVGSVRAEGVSRGIHWPSRAVLPIAVLIVLIAFVEGGLSDWGGIYLRQGVGSEPEVAAFAYAAFALGLFAGRIVGDRAKDRIGSIRLIQWGMVITAVAVAAFLIVGDALVALAGLFVAGVGIANTVPQLFAAAARIPPPGPSLSTAFTFLTLAFVVGPPIIGATSDLFGISTALGLFVLASLVVAAAVTRVTSAETNPRFAPGGRAADPVVAPSTTSTPR